MRRLFLLAASLIAAVGLSLSSAPAFAAGPYPPPPAGPTVTCAIGVTVQMTFTGFRPGTGVSFFINGTQEGSGTAAADGTVTVTVTCSDPHIANNGGTPIAAVFGNNSNNAVGTGPAGQALTVAGTVIIPNSATTPTTTVLSGTSGTSGTGSSSGSSSSGSSLAFTGADIAATVIGGLALIAMGLGLVTFTRRRRHSHI